MFLFLTLHATAQYKQHQVFEDYYAARAIGGERVLQRMYFGIGRHFVTGSMQLHYSGPDSTGEQVKKDYDKKLLGKRSFMFQVGSFFPIALLSDKSMLALNTELMFSYAELDYDSIVFYPQARYHKPVPFIIMGAPVSIDFKTGGDVALSKVQRQMFTIGAGLLGGISTASVVKRRTELPLTAIPFVKAEVGFFAGIAFKLRGVAYLRSAININETLDNVFAQDRIGLKMQAGYGYHLSLIITPFSYGWRSEEWY